jgi:tRNA-splicing ligase RtcB
MAIRTFGEHDPATVRQLENCVAAEEGAEGVLCADGHLGYSMPIGGVVAYRDHVSPSAVGSTSRAGTRPSGPTSHTTRSPSTCRA